MNIEQSLSDIGNWLQSHGIEIVLIAILASLARRFGMLLISRVVHRSIESSDRIEKKRDRKLRADTIIGMIDSVFKILTAIVVMVLVIGELGLVRYLLPLLGSAVAISLIVGFGIQTFVKDLVCGFFIVAENQYRVGDVVSLTTLVGGDLEGMVVRITLRTTVLRDNEGAIHFIPNGNISRAANLTLDYAKINIELPVPLDSDFAQLEKTVNALGLKMHKTSKWHRKMIQAPYYHGVQSLNGEEAVIEVRAQTVPAAQWKVSSELRQELANLLSESQKSSKKSKSK